MSEPTKVCGGACGRTLPASAFSRHSGRADGLQSSCRECQAGKKAAWNDANRAKKIQYDRDRRSAKKGKAVAIHETPAHDTATALADGDAVQHNGLANMARVLIVPSLTNPRKNFDAQFIKDLAESIKSHGIAQPLLIRSLPGSRLQETFTDRRKDAPRPTHEIVAGEQRWRASEIAGLRDLPVLIRDLTDAQVLELQLIENLKRRDLHPMEEAEGYERLRAESGLEPEEIARRIGKGRTYVYKTLKLLDLNPEAREAFYAGKLTRSTAELVAFRPAHLQPELLKDLTATDFHGEPMSYRKAKDLVDERYMLRLGSAPFKITDESLLPAAGSCRTCPKRSGAAPDLFDDVAHADTCTDPKCFAEKKEAHYAKIKAEAEARGQSVIVGKEAKEIMPNSATLRGYTKVDDHQALGGQMKTLRKVLGKDMPTTTLLEDPQTHEMIEVLPTAVVGKLLKDQGIAKAPAVEASEAEAKRRGIEKFEKAWRRTAIEQVTEVAKEAPGGGFNAPVLRLIARLLLDGLGTEQRTHICALLELGKVAPREAIDSHITDCSEDQIELVVVLLLMQHDMGAMVDGATGKATPAPHVETMAKAFFVDLTPIKQSVKADIRKAASEEKVASAAAAVKSQAPTKPARKPKTTKAEASTAIAAELQAASNPNAFEVGQRVRLKADLRKGSDVIHTRGVEAEVVRPLGDRAWMVQPDSVSFSLSADYTEMEAI